MSKAIVFSKENEDEILRLFDSGVYIKQLSLKYGVSRPTIRKIIMRYGRDVKMLKGNEHPSWKGGTGLKHGYMTIYNPNHHRASSIRRVYEHILILEKYIGRPITKSERVHHIDFDRRNNKIHNLFLCGSDSEHMKIQGQYNKVVSDLIKRNIIKFTNGKYFLSDNGRV